MNAADSDYLIDVILKMSRSRSVEEIVEIEVVEDAQGRDLPKEGEDPAMEAEMVADIGDQHVVLTLQPMGLELSPGDHLRGRQRPLRTHHRRRPDPHQREHDGRARGTNKFAKRYGHHGRSA